MPDIEGRETSEHDQHEHAKQLHSRRPWLLVHDPINYQLSTRA